MSEHKASFLDGKGEKFRTGTTETKQPGQIEVLIKVGALAINPVDWKIQDSGWLIKNWPAIMGEDVAGEIEAVGDGVTRFKTGQRVLAHSPYLLTQRLEQGGFQEKVVVPENAVAQIPAKVQFQDATVLPLAVSTAAAGLYQKKKDVCLELPLPTANPEKTNKTLLVWGGSSSVGTAAIQLAVASGVTVVTTCSPRNFQLVEKLGAKAFDYNSPSIVGDLVAELKKGDFVGGYDAIGERESSMQCAQVIASFGGGILASVLVPPEEIPANVQSKQVFALSIFAGENSFVGKGVYEDFLPQALESGQFVPAPPAQVVGSSIDDVQEACQKQKAGVSGKKIVVTL